MAQLLKEYEGTWEEILSHSEELTGYQVSLRVFAPDVEPEETGLSLEEVGKALRISQTYLVGRTESGALPSYCVGNERRIRRSDLALYRETYKRDAQAALAEMAADAQEMGLY